MQQPLRGPIVLIGTLDTKGEEILFLKQCLSTAGLDALVIDAGVLGTPPFLADVSRDEIAALAGTRLEDLVFARDRGQAIAAMERGVASWFHERRDTIRGVLAIGGSAGTSVATAGMRELPVGIPKLMVSTVASGNTRPYIGTSDIAMLYPVADFAGLNRLTRNILANAANAMAGMCTLPAPATTAGSQRPLLAATMFGVTTPCVNRVRELLDAEGFELLIFHATGSGGEAMEQLIGDDFFRGVLDITTTELADELVGGVLSAGPHRLEAAGRLGIPQVISVGALDMVNFGPRASVPEKFCGRTFYEHNPSVTLMRTTVEENRRLGELIAQKANRARGRIKIVLPLRGVSAIDAPGQPFYDPAATSALFDAIRQHATVEITELDVHVNDPKFAEGLVTEFMGLLEGASGNKNAFA